MAAFAVDALGARGDELAGDIAGDLERALVRVEGVVEVARRVGEVTRLRVVVLAKGDDAGEIETAQGGDEVDVVGEEVAHPAPFFL